MGKLTQEDRERLTEEWLREALDVFVQLRHTRGMLDGVRRTLYTQQQAAAMRPAKDKMPPCPIADSEWRGLWSQVDTHFRPLVKQLATLWGVTVETW
jgi:hypothetical protein